MIPSMTFEAFRLTGRDVDNINEELCAGTAEDEPNPGRMYSDYCYIERGLSAAWCLTIGNDSEESDDLERLERKLYDWARAEGAL